MTMRLARDQITAGPFEEAHSKAAAYGSTLSSLILAAQGGVMPADYEEVLKDLEIRESQLLTELNAIRAAKPGIQFLLQAKQSEGRRESPQARFAGLGGTAAIRLLFENEGDLLTREEIHRRLKVDGWTTKATDEVATIHATLSQMRDMEKVNDRWRKRAERVSPEVDKQSSDPALTGLQEGFSIGLERLSGR